MVNNDNIINTENDLNNYYENIYSTQLLINFINFIVTLYFNSLMIPLTKLNIVALYLTSVLNLLLSLMGNKHLAFLVADLKVYYYFSW